MSESSKPALKLRWMSRTHRKTLTPAMLCSTRTRPLKCGGWPVFPAPSVRPLGQVFALDTLGNRVDRTLKNTQNRSNTQEGDYPKIGVHYTLGLPSWSGSATPTGPTARRLSDCWSRCSSGSSPSGSSRPTPPTATNLPCGCETASSATSRSRPRYRGRDSRFKSLK